MKVTTEKLPKSTLSLQIELDREQLERGIDQAARRLSQKFPIHGFRPGKAPRFIIERTYGRPALIEEASEDLINKAYQAAIKQEQIEVIGQPQLQTISSADPFIFTVQVPVPPTVDVGDYRAIRVPLLVEPVTDEQIERALDVRRDKHVVLQELDEARPAEQGDQLRVNMTTIIDGQPADDDAAGAASEQTIDLEPGRLVDELYAGLLGMTIGEKKEITATLPDDHADEAVRGKPVVFTVEVLGMQRRMVPEWDELPTLEDFAGTLEELRAKVRGELEDAARQSAERAQIDSYIEQLVAQTSYDIPDVMVHDLAHDMLHDQERQFARYGITLEQMLQYRGKTHEQAVEELIPNAEQQTKVTLALREVVRGEGLSVGEDDLESELTRLLADYPAEQRAAVDQMLRGQMLSSVMNMALDRKLRARLTELAGAPAAESETPVAAEAAE